MVADMEGSYRKLLRPAPQEEWSSPEQNSAVDEAQRKQGVDKMMQTLKAEWERSGTYEASTLYVPIHGNLKLDLGNMTTERPPDADEWPGYQVWTHVDLSMWQSQLVNFCMTAAFELIDLQSDITLALAVCIDRAYGAVPFHFKASFVLLTALSMLLEFGIALNQVRAHKSKDPRYLSWRFLAQSWILNWVAARVEVQVAPARMSPYGAHQLGRNLGSSVETSGYPLMMMGFSGIENFLRTRAFLVRLPKVFFENILLFALTIWIQTVYVDSWGATAIFSAFMSTLSLVIALKHTVQYLCALRGAKRWCEQASEDTQGFVAEYDKNFAKKTLTENLMACPLL